MKESWCACVRGRWQRNLVCTQQHRTTVWGWKITDVSLKSADCFHAAIVNSNSCLRSSPSPLLVSHRSRQHILHTPPSTHCERQKKSTDVEHSDEAIGSGRVEGFPPRGAGRQLPCVRNTLWWLLVVLLLLPAASRPHRR